MVAERRFYRLKDIAERCFGRLTVIRFSHMDGRYALWLCRCECGNETIVRGCNLKSANTVSCGCVKRERQATIGGRRTHGRSHTSIYRRWQTMIQRCHNPKDHRFVDWGGRGIMVCDRWLHSFETFYADMGEPPPGLVLDRKDNNGNYEPGNCQWATSSQSAGNRRRVTTKASTMRPRAP
jgi:hypothetical protein